MNRGYLMAAAAFLALLLATMGLTACGGDSGTSSSAGTTVAKTSSSTDGSDGDGPVFTGSAQRAETFCFNGKCSTCTTTDKLTLTLDGEKVRLAAEGPVLTFPGCAAEADVSNSEWTLQGSYDAGAGGAGTITITGCKGDTVTGAKWEGSGSGTIDSGGAVKADLQCTGTDEASKESDKAEWKGVALTRK